MDQAAFDCGIATSSNANKDRRVLCLCSYTQDFKMTGVKCPPVMQCSAHTGIDLEPRNGVGLDFMTHQIGGGGSGGQEPAMTQQPEAPAAENGPSGGHNQWDLAGASEKPPVQVGDLELNWNPVGDP